MLKEEGKSQNPEPPKEDMVGISKKALLAALQKRWNGTNGQGFLSVEEEIDEGSRVAAVEDFLVEVGILTREDLNSLSTLGWRIQKQ